MCVHVCVCALCVCVCACVCLNNRIVQKVNRLTFQDVHQVIICLIVESKSFLVISLHMLSLNCFTVDISSFLKTVQDTVSSNCFKQLVLILPANDKANLWSWWHGQNWNFLDAKERSRLPRKAATRIVRLVLCHWTRKFDPRDDVGVWAGNSVWGIKFPTRNYLIPCIWEIGSGLLLRRPNFLGDLVWGGREIPSFHQREMVFFS